MKLLAFSALFLGITSNLFAQGSGIVQKQTVLHEKTHFINIELNTDTVLCSRADYGAEFLKILIPQLSAVTLLNHRNEGAGAPCVAAGMCRSEVAPDGLEISQVLSPNRPTEGVFLHIRVSRVDTFFQEQNVCESSLVEEVGAPIRGLLFEHRREQPLGNRSVEDCQ